MGTLVVWRSSIFNQSSKPNEALFSRTGSLFLIWGRVEICLCCRCSAHHYMLHRRLVIGPQDSQIIKFAMLSLGISLTLRRNIIMRFFEPGIAIWFILEHACIWRCRYLSLSLGISPISIRKDGILNGEAASRFS